MSTRTSPDRPVPRVAVVLPPREGFSPTASGAVGLLVHRLARAPSRFTVEVIGSPGTQAPFADVPFRPAQFDWVPARRNLRYAAGVAGVLRADPPDLIEVHNRPEVAWALARHLPNSAVGLVLHNDPLGMRRAGNPSARVGLLKAIAGVATVSAWLRDRFLEGVPGGEVQVLPNCLDLAAVPPGPPQPMRARRVLFAGRVVADKGADSFVAAWAGAGKDLPGWEAEMIGADRFRADSPETPFLRTLRPQAAAAGVRLTGYHPHEEVLAAMSQAAIVVVPSRWAEPFGLTALEAMACGAALICAPRGGLPEVAGDCAVWIDPDRPEEIAAAIRDLAGDLPRRIALAEAGRARAQRFDVTQAAAARDTWRAGLLAAHA